LKRAGVVTDRKEGLWVYYRLATPLAEHANRLIECLNSCCAESPEMQRDVAKLQQVKAGQLVKLQRRARSVAAPQPTAAAAPPSEPAPAPATDDHQLQVELL
jgi:hypothetical protein